MAIQLTTVGHAIFDIRCYVEALPIPDKTVFITAPIRSSCGGSAANVAAVASKLGVKCRYIGTVGDDEHGRFILNSLRKSRVDASKIRKHRGESGTSIILIDNSGQVEVIEWLGMSNDYFHLGESDIIGTHLHMTGTDLNVLKRASAIAKKKKMIISFDPGRSISRLGFEKMKILLIRAKYLILNRKEFRQLANEYNPRAFCRKFNLIIIIKAGSRPVQYWDTKKSHAVKAFKVKAVDTIGAGDCFAAGFLTANIEGKEVKESLRFACAVSAQKVMRRGAQNIPEREGIERFLKKEGK
ncbi:hypothetical protein COT30_00040 [Candidatus Micrarchaeota archaeon CG08_land_8_20_14_0_20_49_17]|nr:MAG: hypothetical protein AUJ13_00185 [Candidatus Micrarchaeota archaeon CG1_02_49_24]PIU10291.1 MAG: hypothetical protein COT30_00040 [Candidatus Micrarchaeota archaeon CG08_land_8_20_14_0_20_49_17]PIU81760.1 MAG: hypothetical protein COS70_02525 [Candidatus Micrarchaeota archaeon CG06_land_8_20_14_3_00_50_6]HII53335.1 carbohydrate kinase family protein [Candidatus Micrarchaeota archaeon]